MTWLHIQNNIHTSVKIDTKPYYVKKNAKKRRLKQLGAEQGKRSKKYPQQ